MEGISIELQNLPKVESLENITKNIEISGDSLASKTHPDRNEDALFFDQEKGIFGVFDGMSGETEAELASHTCCDEVKSNLSKNEPQKFTDYEVGNKLIDAFFQANDKLCEKAKKYGEATVGTTGTFGFIYKNEKNSTCAAIASIGDSRAYLLRGGNLEQITADDNNLPYIYGKEKAIAIQAKFNNVTTDSELSEQEKVIYGRRNEIYRFFGMESVTPAVKIINLQPGDRLLLCTDGISDNLTDKEISSILEKKDSSEVTSKNLIQKSLSRSQERSFRSKKDDMTALVVDLLPEKPEYFIPEVGKTVTLQRSSGLIESGWEIKIIDNQKQTLVLHKKAGEDSPLEKTCKIADIERYNRKARNSDISTSNNFEELFYTLRELGGVQGSSDYFPSEHLIEVINKLKDKDDPLKDYRYVTSQLGLRDTVKKLIFKNK